VVAVAVSHMEVAVAFSVADDRWCLIRESSYPFFTDLNSVDLIDVKYRGA
jgi:hypothetical protein